METPTIFAVLTPPGRGAVATIALRGPRSTAIVGRRFESAASKPLDAYATGRIVFGRFAMAAGAAEELVVGLVGREDIEIHCHGGATAVEAVAKALVADGAQRLTAEQWSWQTADDALAAEAALALVAATTERAAAILLDQQRGALRRALAAVGDDVFRNDFAPAADKLRALMAQADLGLHLTKPWKVVIAGPPNVGKSSLANAILGYQRSIVFDQPGTTRDMLTAMTALDGWPIELVDTAGLRDTIDPIEAEGVRRAAGSVSAADAVLAVTDCTRPWSDQARDFPADGHRLIVVHNKCDLASPPSDGRPAGIATSAVTSQGLDELTQRLAVSLVPVPPAPAAGVPFARRQIRLLEAALNAVECGQPRLARQAIDDLLAPTRSTAQQVAPVGAAEVRSPD